MKSKQLLLIFPGIVLFILFNLFVDMGNSTLTSMASIVLLMAYLWITEAIPLAATALLPFALMPVMGIASAKDIAPKYMNATIFLFLGGFMMALSIEKWNLHRRIALHILIRSGKSASTMILGFMAASYFLSMWISNTATALIMLPIGIAVLSKIPDSKPIQIPLLLSIAYACSVGGMATLVGTPPNLVFQKIFQDSFPQYPQLGFGHWMLIGIPLSASLLVTIWAYLTYSLRKTKHVIDKQIFSEELSTLGPMSREEKIVIAFFLCTSSLWIFRADLNFGLFKIPGWENLFPWKGMLHDGVVAVFLSAIMFFIPSSNPDKKFLLEKDIFQKIPWSIVLLFGGGFAMAYGIRESGLDLWLGQRMRLPAGVPDYFWILAAVLFMTFLTEVTSNTASAQLVLPIIAGVAVSNGIAPFLLMISVTFAASQAFMMPVATPPNAIVFATEMMRVKDMARIGLLLNLGLGVFSATLLYIFVPILFKEFL